MAPHAGTTQEPLNSTHVLVGESGGLSAIYENKGNILGAVCVETEHGPLYLDPEEPAPVLDV